jgi:hypothetical protein
VANESEYSKKLRDPRWQKKRLEILGRDKFTCRMCADTTITLHVHHTYYASGRDPWDYPDRSLVTLCETCHEGETEGIRAAKEFLFMELARRGFISDDFYELGGVMRGWQGDGSELDYGILLLALTAPDFWRFLRQMYTQEMNQMDIAALSWAVTTPDVWETIRKNFSAYLRRNPPQSAPTSV